MTYIIRIKGRDSNIAVDDKRGEELLRDWTAKTIPDRISIGSIAIVSDDIRGIEYVESKAAQQDAYTPPTLEEAARIEEIRKEISQRWPSRRERILDEKAANEL